MEPSDKPKTRKKQREATHSALLAAARKTFKKRGFTSTTIRQLAQEANVSTGTVMAHFGCKEELLYEVLHNDINQIVEEVIESLDRNLPISELLLFVGEKFLKGYAVEPDLYADFLEHSLFARGPWGERFEQQVEMIGKQIATCFATSIQLGELRPDTDIRTATMAFFANYYFVLIQQIKSRFKDVEAGVQLLKLLILHQISGLKHESDPTGQE